VLLGQFNLDVSRSSRVSAQLAPLGNPLLEVTAQRGNREATRDVAINGELWIPVEIAGQRSTRKKESADYIAWHQALLAQARATAIGRTVRVYGSWAVGWERLRALRALTADARAEATYYGERMAAGDATERDAALSALEAARHDVMLVEAQSDLIQAVGVLRALTGVNVADQQPGSMLPPLEASFRGMLGERLNAGTLPELSALAAQARYQGSSRERWAREGISPLAIGLVAGRGDLGETRLGAGLGYAIPTFRRNQVESSRAEAERLRALAELELRRRVAAQRFELIALELTELRRAVEVLTTSALPAAERAVHAAIETHRAGKGEVLPVLVSRRDLSTLSLRRLELLEKAWIRISELVEMTGELP